MIFFTTICNFEKVFYLYYSNFTVMYFFFDAELFVWVIRVIEKVFNPVSYVKLT